VVQHYSGKKAAEVVGITYRQLDYWARTDLVRPSVTDAAGSGSRRQYSYRDLLELKVIKSLLDAGIKLESVRSVFQYLREQLGEDIASAQLVISGGTAILVRDDDELVDVLKQGQFVMSGVLSLGGVQREVDAAIVDLFRAAEAEVTVDELDEAPAQAEAGEAPSGSPRAVSGV
jgi:DNA-binding transcriptional MerR regulator